MAIQVGGSTVINNSLQLQNIASLDSTTSATIGAAAGGGFEFIGETTITSDTSYIDYTFPSGYKGFKFILNQMCHSDPNANTYRECRVRLTNSSGTLITDSTQYLNANANRSGMNLSYWWGAGGSNGGYYMGEPSSPRTTLHLEVWNPLDSSKATWGRGWQLGLFYINFNQDYMGENYHIMKDPAQNNGIRFYPAAGQFDSTMQGYQIWGYK